MPTNLKIYLAVPPEEGSEFAALLTEYALSDRITVYCSHPDDPLARMMAGADLYHLDSVVRICHDKILINSKDLEFCVQVFEKNNLDYLYSSEFVDGSGFEIISTKALREASSKFSNVEHISYAIKAVTKNMRNICLEKQAYPYRFLIDYPDDLRLMELIFSQCGNDCSLKDAMNFVDANPWLLELNKLPLVTIYTCAHNSARWIEQCMYGVAFQDYFDVAEYILIDDCSTDQTPLFMAKFANTHRNTKWFRNEKNLGLASSSNIALSKAKGKYIMRLDADDFFIKRTILKDMVAFIETNDFDVIYPNSVLSNGKIQNGSEHHHIGGALFRSRAINHIKFTDQLRGLDGYDFFERAKHQLKIGYFNQETFNYRQHNDSLSHVDAKIRVQLKKSIDERLSNYET